MYCKRHPQINTLRVSLDDGVGSSRVAARDQNPHLGFVVFASVTETHVGRRSRDPVTTTRRRAEVSPSLSPRSTTPSVVEPTPPSPPPGRGADEGVSSRRRARHTSHVGEPRLNGSIHIGENYCTINPPPNKSISTSYPSTKVHNGSVTLVALDGNRGEGRNRTETSPGPWSERMVQKTQFCQCVFICHCRDTTLFASLLNKVERLKTTPES